MDSNSYISELWSIILNHFCSSSLIKRFPCCLWLRSNWNHSKLAVLSILNSCLSIHMGCKVGLILLQLSQHLCPSVIGKLHFWSNLRILDICKRWLCYIIFLIMQIVSQSFPSSCFYLGLLSSLLYWCDLWWLVWEEFTSDKWSLSWLVGGMFCFISSCVLFNCSNIFLSSYLFQLFHVLGLRDDFR